MQKWEYFVLCVTYGGVVNKMKDSPSFMDALRLDTIESIPQENYLAQLGEEG